MFDACVSFVFNIGEPQFVSSTMLEKLNAGDYVHAAHEMTRWFETPGSELGLLRRRLAEASMFLEDDLPS
jgi:lysozyme